MRDFADKPEIVIVGAGAMGCLFAARLAEQGASVTLVDVDRERLSAIDRAGVTLTDDQGSRTLPVAAMLARDVKTADVILLFTKGIHSASAVASVGHLAACRPVAVTVQNGIGNAEILAATFGQDRVLFGTAHVPADLVGQAGVSTHGFGTVAMGGFTAAANALAGPVADWFTRAGFPTTVTDDAEAAVWEKVAFNAALNPVAMVCEAPNAALNNAPGRRIAECIVAEVVAVAQAKGIVLDQCHILNTIDKALQQHGDHKASMLQDREQGRQTEIEFINGAVAEEGRKRGVATPACDVISDLVRLIELRRVRR